MYIYKYPLVTSIYYNHKHCWSGIPIWVPLVQCQAVESPTRRLSILEAEKIRESSRCGKTLLPKKDWFKGKFSGFTP